MASLAIALFGAVILGVVYFQFERRHVEAELHQVEKDLRRDASTEVFHPSMVEGLPEPAQRFLLRAIAPGTRLARSVELSMRGSMRLKPDAELLPMSATQVLAPPFGFVWRAQVGKGVLRFSGFDRYANAMGVMRWWLLGVFPLVNTSGEDIDRSAAGRLGGEAVFVPAMLLPQNGASWFPLDAHSARFRVFVDKEPVDATIVVDEAGRLKRVSVQRWRDNAGDGKAGYVRFDVDQWSDENTFQGYTIQTRFRAGWKLGESDEFPFFFAIIDSARYQTQ